MGIFEKELKQTELAGDREASHESQKKREIIQVTFDEFLTSVDKHKEQCKDDECRLNSANNWGETEEARGHRWDQAALHMLNLAKVMPSYALHLKETAHQSQVKLQILIPVGELNRPWAEAYLDGCGESTISRDVFYPYTPEMAEDPVTLSKDAFEYIENKDAKIQANRAKLAEIATLESMLRT